MEQVERGRAGVARVVGGAVGGLRAVARGLRGTAHEAGMATAEYAIVLLAAVGFAGLLVAILKSSEVRAMLTRIVRDALTL